MFEKSRAISSSNLAMLEIVAHKLAELNNDVVYLGGCATSLLLNDPLSTDVRATKDVDCIIDVISRLEYNKFERKLRKKGFEHDQQSEIICRWVFEDIILDVMPTDESILGFANKWYKPAIKYSTAHNLSDDIKINFITSPYFLATKLEAFKDRGKGDMLLSHDFEDIVTVMAGRNTISEEVRSANHDVKTFIKSEFNTLLNSDSFRSILPGHLKEGPESVTMQRVEIVINRIKEIVYG